MPYPNVREWLSASTFTSDDNKAMATEYEKIN